MEGTWRWTYSALRYFFLRVLVIVEGYYLAYGPHIGPAIKWKGLA